MLPLLSVPPSLPTTILYDTEETWHDSRLYSHTSSHGISSLDGLKSDANGVTNNPTVAE